LLTPYNPLLPKRRANSEDESDTTENDADRDPREDTCGRTVSDVIDEKPDEHSADDAADQEPAKAREVAATQASVGVVIGHPKRSLSIWSARALTSAVRCGV
jgi:hypothetical protein